MRKNILLDRARYKLVLDWCNENGIAPQYSKIKLSQPLKDGVGNYQFNINKDNVNASVGEVGIDRNDLFIPFGFGLFHTIDGVTPSGKYPLLSYPVQASANADGYRTKDIEALYNGSLLIRLDQTQVNQSFPLEVFRYVPETQPIAGVEAQFDIEAAMHQLVPNYFLQGTFDTKIEVAFNGTGSSFAVAEKATPTVASTTRQARLVFLMFGVLVKNGAEQPRINVLRSALSGI